jgi:hypothetical protein
MKVTQISVFLENKQGRLLEVCELLGQAGVNIRALNVAESDSFGVLRIVVDKVNDAMTALSKAGFTARLTDIVAVEVDDHPGGLAHVLRVLADKDINVEYMYGFVEKSTDKALMVFRFEAIDAAIAVLTAANIKVVTQKNIPNL